MPRTDPSSRPAARHASATTPSGRRPAEPARISIASAGAAGPVERMGAKGGALQIPPPGRAGWFDAGPRPGEIGRAVIVSHVDSKQGPALFFNLLQQQRGSRIVVRDRRGAEHRFAVVRAPPDREEPLPAAASVYGASARPMLVLITCGGPFSAGHRVPRQRDPLRARSLRGSAQASPRAGRTPGEPRRYRGRDCPPPTNISLARGAPSLDIIAVDELRAAARPSLRAGSRPGPSPTEPRPGTRALLAWIAEKHGVEPDQVIATNGSMQADAFLFQQLVQPGDLVVVEAPDLRPHAAVAAEPRRRDPGHPARGRRHRRRRARARRSRPARGRRSRTSSPTSRTRPAAPSRSRSAGACSSWPRSTASRSSRTTRTWSCASRASPSRRCSRSTSAAASSTRRRSRRRSAPASGWATWSGPPRTIGADRASWPRAPTSRRAWSPRRSSPSSARRARSTARSRR